MQNGEADFIRPHGDRVEIKTVPPISKALMDQNAAALITSCPVPAALAVSIVTSFLAPVAIKLRENAIVSGKRITIYS